MNIIRLATRQSPLALWQANYIKTRIQDAYPEIAVELVPLLTRGDKDQSPSLQHIGGKASFVKELQLALIENHADIAVHSVKDMSVLNTEQLCLVAITERAKAMDVVVSLKYSSLEALPPGSRVGTSSPRRTSQLMRLRPDLKILSLRGNLGTRLAKLERGDYDAIILAAAGLERLGIENFHMYYLDTDKFIPAIGQGALGLECRFADLELIEKLEFLNDPNTRHCVTAERAVNKRLGGNCYVPIAAFAEIKDKRLHLNAMVASLDGHQFFKAHASATMDNDEQLGLQVAELLLAQGADAVLKNFKINGD